MPMLILWAVPAVVVLVELLCGVVVFRCGLPMVSSNQLKSEQYCIHRMRPELLDALPAVH